MKEKQNNINRWRLILGSFSDLNLDNEYSDIDESLNFLYDREYDSAGKEKSQLTVPIWINKIKTLFPKKTAEIMQRDALEKYKMTELLTDENVIKNLEPNFELLKSILSFKDMMNPAVKKIAYNIVREVVEKIKEKIEIDIKKVFYGKKLLNTNSNKKTLKNLDIKKTINKNLKNYNADTKQLLIDKVYFNENTKRYNTKYLIILVDQSASMIDSVIYSSILSSIFSRLSFLEVKFIVFDTAIVDLSGIEPIEALFKVQLGGGTDIVMALEYAKKITSFPDRTIVLLISDLEDSNEYKYLYKSANDIIESKSKLIVLPALDYNFNHSYNKEVAINLKKQGAKVESLTPYNIAKYINEILY